MKNFNMGSIKEWDQISCGELLDFPVPASGYRSVQFEIMADKPVSVFAVTDDFAVLVGVGDGQLFCKFTIDESVGVVVEGEEGARVYIRTHAGAMLIPESDDASFTTIEPRQVEPTDDLRRMMALVKLNQDRREQMLMQEINSLRAAHEAEVLERVNSAAAAPPPPPPVEETTDGN